MAGRLGQPDIPIHANCAKNASERAIANSLQDAALVASGALASRTLHGIRNPFVICELVQPELGLQQMSVAASKLCALGKLAKSGHFFASENGAVLAKRVEDLEAQELKKWGDLALTSFDPDNSTFDSQYPGGCLAFGKTLLVPVVLDFAHKGRQYVAMPNLTHYYARASPNTWIVRAAYDAKPLPNLGEGLVKLVKGLRNEWGQVLGKVNTWKAWNEVRSQLMADLKFLTDRVVDFSLFVHVIQHEGHGDANASMPAEFSPEKGCVIAPTKNIALCFRILDFLTPLDWKRELESQYKASKFDDYAKNFLLAFDCIGDISREDCTSYKAVASITDAMEVSKAMAKAAFIGVKAFPASYTCTCETPRLRFRSAYYTPSVRAGYLGPHFGKTLTTFDDEERSELETKHRQIGKEVVFQSRRNADPKKNVELLQAIASKEAGTGYIKDFCDCSQKNCTDLECTKILLQYAMSENGEERPAGADHLDLEQCARMVNEFSTEGYMSSGRAGKSMHNVLWAPGKNVMIAVRGLPKIPIINATTYMHQTALERGRMRNCFLKMRYLRCTPEDRKGVYFNYKQHFGSLEIMFLQAGEFSGDQDAYAKAGRMGIKIVTK